jgi:hypothetical protein
MRRRVTGSALALALLVTPLLGCSSQEQVVMVNTPPTHTPNPAPSVPVDQSLVRYVSPTGDDHNFAGTRERPWRTLKTAFKRLYAGQVLYVRGGSYHETIDHIHLHAGRADKPITVLAYPGENPVLVGSISLRRPANWLIDNLDVTGDPTVPASLQPSFMVKVVGGRAWTWQNSEFTGTTGRANVMITRWGLIEPAGFKFRDNCLHDVPQPPQGSTNLFLGPMKWGAKGIVSHNVIFNYDGQPNVRLGSAAGAPYRVKLVSNTIFGGSLGISVRGRPHHVKISRNIVGGSFGPAEIRFPQGVSLGTTVTNNVAVNATQILRPKVREHVHGFSNVVLPENPSFVDTTRCDGFQSGIDAMIPYGASAP